MKIVVALDKFKGSLSAAEACAAVRRGLLAVRPETRVVVQPMADGGDGTADALHAALGGEWITASVTGPMPGTVRSARYLWNERDRLAVVEMAEASGLVWLTPGQRNPLLTTTYGTGELIRAAIERGAQRIWLAVGGSATVDGGVGAAMALGWRFVDAHGQPVGLGGGELDRIAQVVAPKGVCPGSEIRDPGPGIRDSRSESRGRRSEVRKPSPDHGPRITGHESPVTGHGPSPRRSGYGRAGGSGVTVEVLCDVDNPLCGEHGAARVFGPQKGASPAVVKRLEAGLGHLAELVKAQLGKEIRDLPGAGAAGGLGGGAVAFLGARLASGIELVMRASGLARELADADWVITGEGQFDEQSLRGKVVAGVTGLARRAGARVAVLAGRAKLDEAKWRRAGIEVVRAVTPPEMSTAEGIARAEELLMTRAAELELTKVLSRTGVGR